MVVGIWSGESKPHLTEYLEPLISELKNILMNGVYIKSKHISVRMGKIICDTPARCFIKG